MKTIACMQAYFLPYLGYFQLINAVDEFILLDDVNFIKRGWINRNRVELHGHEHLFSLAISDASQNRLIKNHSLANSASEKQKLRHLFHHAYAKAPYYENIAPLLDTIFNYENDNLSEFITFSLQNIMCYLDIDTQLSLASNIDPEPGFTNQARIIKLCHDRKAEQYINPIGGMNLYDSNEFQKNGINISFLKMHEHINQLSIIDVLAKQSRDQDIKLLEAYQRLTNAPHHPQSQQNKDPRRQNCC